VHLLASKGIYTDKKHQYAIEAIQKISYLKSIRIGII
jgi:hypothetical protein